MDTKHPEKIERQPSDVPNASSPGMHSRQISTVSQLSYADGEWAENGGDDFQLDQTLGDVSTLFTNSEAGGKKALNWKKYLKDEKLALDALKFQKSRKNPVQDHPGIAKDLPRTRTDDPYFQKSSNVNALREIACFFCSSNNINYQQGLLEIIVPFLKLRSTTFRTKHCYAYFSSFMRNYFPNILIPTVVNDLKELPHLNAAINYCGILLGYHGNEIANILKVTDLDLRTFVTPWIMTLFSKGTNMDLIYEIFDRYMAENDKLFLFYMVVSLILMKKKEIVEMNDTGDDVKLITYLNRTLKDESLQTLQDVDQLFTIAKKIKELTPLSFETALKQLGLMNVGILSIQEFNEYLSQSIPSTMEIYPFEVVNYLLEKTALDQSDKEKYQIYPKAIEFKVLDCRKMRGAGILPNAIELPEASIKTDEALRSYLIEMCKAETETHICILKSNDTDKEEQTIVANVIKILRSFNKNYVSIVLGGYKAIIKEMDQRKVNIPLARRKRLSVFDQIKSIFGK